MINPKRVVIAFIRQITADLFESAEPIEGPIEDKIDVYQNKEDQRRFKYKDEKFLVAAEWKRMEDLGYDPFAPACLEDKIETINHEENPQFRRDDRFLTNIRDSHDKGWEGAPAEDDRGVGGVAF